MTRQRTFCHRVKLGKRHTARKLQSMMPEDFKRYVNKLRDKLDDYEARLPIEWMLAKAKEHT